MVRPFLQTLKPLDGPETEREFSIFVVVRHPVYYWGKKLGISFSRGIIILVGAELFHDNSLCTIICKKIICKIVIVLMTIEPA